VNVQREDERWLQKGHRERGYDCRRGKQQGVAQHQVSTEALPGLHLDICTAAPNPVNTHPQMAQNESKLSYKEPVLPLRLVLCCTLSSLSCFNLADARP
jgi:hypothetical protein